MLGRSGAASNPDIVVGFICLFFGTLLTSFIVPIFCMCEKPFWVLSGFVVITVISVIVMLTPVGFPYRDEVSPQRFWIYVKLFLSLKYYSFNFFFNYSTLRELFIRLIIQSGIIIMDIL